jgi:hypothetical protein
MNYKVYQADLAADKQDILDFWQSSFPAWPVSKFEMFYENNPDGKATCFVARDEGNHLVGAIALFPRRISVSGRIVRAAVAGDLAIRKDHRGTGLVQALRAEMLGYMSRSGLAFVYGTANIISKKVLEKGTFRSIGDTVWMVKVLRSERYVGRRIKLPALAHMISLPIDWVIRRRYSKMMARMDDVYQWEEPTRFDERFDTLSQAALPMYPITGERSSRFLNWRFVDCPYKEFHVFALSRKSNKELVGYVVYRSTAEGTHIEDFFAAEPDRLLRHLLVEFLAYINVKKSDAVTFYFFGEDRVVSMFEQFGFVKRDAVRTMVIQVDETSPIHDDVLNPRRWHFLYVDNDVDA